MQPEELRIGNLVLTCVPDMEIMIPNLQACVQAIGIFGNIEFQHEFDQNGFSMPIKHIMGIPLTEEWLVRFGFEKQELSISHNTRLYVCIDGGGNYANEGKLLVLSNGTPYLSMPCKYVHQLQNLYCVLTGTELTIK